MNGLRGLWPEDAILAAWNVAGVPLLASAGGAAAALIKLGSEPNATVGILQALAVAGAIVAIATRPTSDAPIGRPTTVPPTTSGGRVPGTHHGGSGLASASVSGGMIAMLGPLVGGIAFVAGSASDHLGIALDGLAIGLATVALVAATAFGDRLPVIDARLRRALVMPFVLVCAGVFNGFAADLLAGLDVGVLAGAGVGDETGFALFVIVMLVGGLAAFYAALVAAPRQLADPERHAFWPVRFAVFVVSALTGIGWLAFFAG